MLIQHERAANALHSFYWYCTYFIVWQNVKLVDMNDAKRIAPFLTDRCKRISA